MLAGMVVVGRLYDPAEFGEYGVFAAFSAIASVMVTLRLDLAVPLGHDNGEMRQIAAASLVMAAMICTTVFGVMLLWNRAIPGVAIGRSGLLLLPLSILLGAARSTLNQFAVALGEFRVIGRRAVAQSVAMVLVQVVWGACGLMGPGLVIGYIFGQLTACVMYVMSVGLPLVKPHHLIGVYREFRQYMMVMAPQGAINSLGTQLPLITVSWLYQSDVVGLFSMTQKVMGMPVGLVSTAMSQVYISFAAARRRENGVSVKGLFFRVSKSLALISCILVLVIWAIGPWLFTSVLGQEWRVSGHYAQLMVVLFAAQMIAVPVSTTLIIGRREKTQLAWDAARMGSVLVIFMSARYWDFSPEAYVMLVALVLSIAYLVLWELSRRVVVSPVSC